MASGPFRFKKFSIEQSPGVHPVGTDGVLLGAWCSVGQANMILDVGCGTGLLALMLAQRSAGHVRISAIDPHEASYHCAANNFSASPWPIKLDVQPVSLQEFRPDHCFDLMVCNPPFYSERTFSPDPERTRARHISELSLELLMKHAARLLNSEGRMCVIMPEKEGRQICELAVLQGLYCNKEMQVRSRLGKPVERLLLEFSRDPGMFKRGTLEIHSGHGYSAGFKSLTADFYLDF